MRKPDTTLANEMQRQMLMQYGPLLGGSALYQALGFPSAAGMRQAALRNQVGVRLFSIENRRGKFALTRDVAHWLAQCAAVSDGPEQGQQGEALSSAAAAMPAGARAARPDALEASCS